MSALADIQREVDRLKRADFRPFRRRSVEIEVGESAAQSIMAVTGDGTLPETIDDVPVKRVFNFPGFEVVIK